MLLIKTLVTFLFFFSGMAANASAQEVLFGKERFLEYKLYCVNISNVKNRVNDLYYKIRACPLDNSPCLTSWTEKTLKYRGRRNNNIQSHCVVMRKPVKMIVTYDWSAENGYQEKKQELEAQVFDWRELVPGTACIRRSFYRFAPYRGNSITIKSGRRKGMRFSRRCEWTKNTNQSIPRGNTGLPDSVVGAWARERGQCPDPDTPVERDKNVLWIQPHAIDRADGQCWLSGSFNLGKRFTARAMCPAGETRYKMVNFTFDRISADSIRVREGLEKRRRYKRCSKIWKPSVHHTRIAGNFAGSSTRISINATVKTRQDNGNLSFDNHKRTMDFQVDAWGIINDKQDFGYGMVYAKSRFGEVTRDSSGNRVGWLVKNDRLVRMRERHTYFEIFSWPLTADRKGIECKLRVDQISKRRDGLRQVIGNSGRLVDILSYSWSDAKCIRDAIQSVEKPTKKETLAAHIKNCSQEKDRLRTISGCTAVLESGRFTKKQDLATFYYRRGVAYIRTGKLKKAIADISEAIKLVPQNADYYTWRGIAYASRAKTMTVFGVDSWQENANARSDFLKALEISPADKYALFNLKKLNALVANKQTQSGNPHNMDKCVKTTLNRKPGAKANDREFELRLENKCREDVVAGAWAFFDRVRGIAVVNKLQENKGDSIIGSRVWTIKLPRKEDPAQALKKIAVWGVPAKAYFDACKTAKKVNWQDKSRCFETVRGGYNLLPKGTKSEKLKLAEFYFMRGKADASGKQAKKAIEDLTYAIELNPTKSDYWAWRGVAHLSSPGNTNNTLGIKLGEVQAIFDLEKALKIDPENKTALYNLLKIGIKPKAVSPIILCENGTTPAQTISLCTDVLTKNKQDERVLARAHIRRGKAHTDAAWHIQKDLLFAFVQEKFISEDDKKTRNLRRRKAAEHRKSAFSDFVAAAKIDPQNPWSYYYLGGMWRTQAGKDKTDGKAKKYNTAIALFTRALKLAPGNREICLSLARTYKNANLLDKWKIADNNCTNLPNTGK